MLLTCNHVERCKDEKFSQPKKHHLICFHKIIASLKTVERSKFCLYNAKL